MDDDFESPTQISQCRYIIMPYYARVVKYFFSTNHNHNKLIKIIVYNFTS